MGIQINGNTNNINAGIGSLSIEDINELDIVGVATAANFKTGVSNLHSLGLTLSGGQLDVGSNIKIGTAGVVTATSFVGSGANLTGIDTDLVNDTTPQLGGNLDNNGKNITFGDSAGSSDDRLTFGAGTDLSIYHDNSNSRSRIEHSTDNALQILQGGNAGMLIQNQNSYNIEIKTNAEDAIKCVANGAVELYHNNSKKLETASGGVTVTGTVAATSYTGDGSNLTGITGTTINNNADNRIITGSGTANTLEGEANFTFNGSKAIIKHGTTSTVSDRGLMLQASSSLTNGQVLPGITLNPNTNEHRPRAGISGIGHGSSNGTAGMHLIFMTAYRDDGSQLTSSDERVRIQSDGNMGVGSASPTQARLVVENSSGNTIAAVKSGNAGAVALGGPSQPRILMEAGQSSSDLLIYTAGGSSWGSPSWSEKFRIKSDGEVNFASDAVFTNSSWTGNKAGKIQHHNNWLYMQAGTSGIKLRSSNGSDETIFSGRTIDITGGRNSSDDALVVHMEDNRYRKIQLAEGTVSHAVGTYGGFIGYDAANNYMTLGTNQAGTVHEGMRFHRSGGYVTKPTQPKFSAYMANTYSWNNQIIVWDSEMYDVGNHYNTSNGKFTAPVAGYYVFGVKFRANGGFSQFGGMWTKNSSTYKRAFGQNSYAQGDCITAVDVIPMSANDTMGLRFEGSHGGATGGAHENGFWGYLLG